MPAQIKQKKKKNRVWLEYPKLLEGLQNKTHQLSIQDKHQLYTMLVAKWLMQNVLNISSKNPPKAGMQI